MKDKCLDRNCFFIGDEPTSSKEAFWKIIILSMNHLYKISRKGCHMKAFWTLPRAALCASVCASTVAAAAGSCGISLKHHEKIIKKLSPDFLCLDNDLLSPLLLQLLVLSGLSVLMYQHTMSFLEILPLQMIPDTGCTNQMERGH